MIGVGSFLLGWIAAAPIHFLQRRRIRRRRRLGHCIYCDYQAFAPAT